MNYVLESLELQASVNRELAEECMNPIQAAFFQRKFLEYSRAIEVLRREFFLPVPPCSVPMTFREVAA